MEQLHSGNSYGRAADSAGLQYWTNKLITGAMTYTQIAASFSVQTEATSLYPFLATPLVDDAAHDNANAFINTVFTQLFATSSTSP